MDVGREPHCPLDSLRISVPTRHHSREFPISALDRKLTARFFLEQNNRIFQTLLEVSASQDKTLTAEHARGMGLDPQGDRSFLMDLLEAYGIDVMLVIDNPCCP